MTNIIITYCDKKYEKNLEYDFVASLFATKFDGKLYIIDYGLTNDVHNRLASHPQITLFKRDIVYKMLHTQCHTDFIDLIKNHTNLLDTIMIIDGGDVWFQRDINDLFKQAYGKLCFTSEPEHCTEKWMLQCINQLTDMKVRSNVFNLLQNKPLLSGGMFIGDPHTMLKFFSNIKILLDKIFKDEFFGVDMIASNYVLYTWLKYDKESHTKNLEEISKTYDYTIITHKDEFSIKNDIIYNGNGDIVHIVHNCGGDNRILKRSYD